MSEKVQLAKVMGVRDYFMLGFGSMVGVGWCVAINNWISAGGGVLITVISFMLVTLMIIPIGLCYAEMCPAMPVAGGVLAYSYKAFGLKASFVTGWLALLAYVNVMPWEAIYINDVINYLFPQMLTGTPLYSLGGAAVYPRSLIFGLMLSGIMIFINWRGTKIASKVQNFCCYLMITGAVIIAIFAFAKCDCNNLLPLHQNLLGKNFSSIPACMAAVFALAPFHFSGFDTICQGAEESSKGIDYRKLGKVIVFGIAITGVYYCLMLMSAGVAYPTKAFVSLNRPSICYMFVVLYPGIIGRVLYVITLITALAGLFSTWNGFYIAGARLCLGMGRARMLPKSFMKIHKKYKTPIAGNILCGAACLAGPVVGIGFIDPLSIIGSFAFVVCWFSSAAACWKIRTSDKDMERPFMIPGGTAVMKLACLCSAVFALICILPFSPGFMGNVAVIYLVAWSALGAAVYFGFIKYRRQFPLQEIEDTLFEGQQKNENVS
jgi:Amino acid transporters